jgi:hypothetical protein
MDVDPQSAPTAYVNQPYSATFHPSYSAAAVTPFSIEWTSGTLPEGLSFSLSPDGYQLTISGTPTKAESTQFTLTARDSSGKFGSRTYTLEVQLVDTTGVTGLVNSVLATVSALPDGVNCVLAGVQAIINHSPPAVCRPF